MMVHIKQIVSRVEAALERSERLMVAIDGCGGSGKTSLAQTLANHSKRIEVVSIDDFYFPSARRAIVQRPLAVGPNWDWDRLKRQVLEPLSAGVGACYQRYDWESDRLAEWHSVSSRKAIVVEGVYATQTDLARFYDVTVWVETNRSLRLARGLERDGQGSRGMWEQTWMPAEDYYVSTQDPRTRADIVIDGSARDFLEGYITILKGCI